MNNAFANNMFFALIAVIALLFPWPAFSLLFFIALIGMLAATVSGILEEVQNAAASKAYAPQYRITAFAQRDMVQS